MAILVFGKTGQVATQLLRDQDVVAVGRAEADLSDPDACARLVLESKATGVINAAAYTAVDDAEENAALAHVVNADAPGAIARACAQRDLPFVHISTDYVFDGSGETPWHPGDPVNPLGVYGRSKRAGEVQVAQAGGRHAILRTSWVFSPTGRNFVRTMLALAESRNSLNIVSDQIGGPTPAADIATACLHIARALEGGASSRGIYHFSGAPDASWACFARETFAQAGLSVAVSDIASADYPQRAPRPMNSRLDCADLETDFGLKRPDWKVGLYDTLTTLGAI